MKAVNPLIIAIGFALLQFCGLNRVQSQCIQINANYVQGIRYTSQWDLFRGGFELSGAYRYPLNDWHLTGGLNFRTIQWGNQLALSLGVIKPLGNRFELGGEVQNGLALFRERSLYVVSSGVKVNYLGLKKEKLVAGISLEGRYSICPGYRKYSQIYSLLEIPIGGFIRF